MLLAPQTARAAQRQSHLVSKAGRAGPVTRRLTVNVDPVRLGAALAGSTGVVTGLRVFSFPTRLANVQIAPSHDLSKATRHARSVVFAIARSPPLPAP